MRSKCVFDGENYEALNAARGPVVVEIVDQLGERLGLRTAIDVGCGTGFFTALLESLGLRVLGVDGREENIEEAQKRFPRGRFLRMDAEDAALRGLGSFDLVFCFGLLYHLENPLLAIRHLRAMTKELLLVEGVISPGEEPSMTLIDEASSQDQGLNHVAFYPTEACLAKMLYRGGFPYIYRVTRVPEHPEYHDRPGWRKNRTVLAASCADLKTELLKALTEPAAGILPWDAASGVRGPAALNKLRRFWHRPLRAKLKTIRSLTARLS
jgi:tRNA (mo5U34)-methyltransferase